MRDFKVSKELASSLKAMSKRMRLNGLEMAKATGEKGAHLGGSFSCIEILAVLYGAVLEYNVNNPQNKARDRFLPSKNHCTLAHFPALYEAGFIKKEELIEFQKDGGRLTGYPKNLEVGLEYSGGSLGQAIGVGIGMALSMREENLSQKVFVLMGDGELNEGSVWESFMFASHYKLDNLVVIIDRNHLSYDGDTEDVMKLEPLDEKLKAFNWNVIKCNGHDTYELLQAFDKVKPSNGKNSNGQPYIIIADTIKGKGVSFIENHREWHHHALTLEQYELAKSEIENA